MAGTYVLACEAADYDPQAGTCAMPHYIEQPTGWQALSIEDAQLIGGAIAYLLAIAFVFRLLRKFINQS